ncbi:hypothetical protein HMPREF3222_02282 [Clostridium perfringens]|uniref:Uncharacterized protein n=1 Tax=Clostridium perfringens TaxID=1502 RepID=A0A133MZY8_CLOPF|nr:hypothetical protein HMPREF3222_02282 [Clostridium perfringens]
MKLRIKNLFPSKIKSDEYLNTHHFLFVKYLQYLIRYYFKYIINIFINKFFQSLNLTISILIIGVVSGKCGFHTLIETKINYKIKILRLKDMEANTFNLFFIVLLTYI